MNISRPAPITLEDHTEETSEQTGSLWARRVSIDDYVVIQGNVPSLGDYTVWNCNIETLDVSIYFLIYSLVPRMSPSLCSTQYICVGIPDIGWRFS